MQYRHTLMILIAGLSACKQSPQTGPAKLPVAACAMPTGGDATNAARAAIARSDYWLLVYSQNGESAREVTPGVKWRRGPATKAAKVRDLKADNAGGDGCLRFIHISIDPQRSPGCCDIPWTPDAFGEKQEAFAAAYNIELIRAPTFIAACGRYEAAPGLRY